MNIETKDIEELVNPETRIFDALILLNNHRCWANSTLESYKNDVKHFEEFLMDHNMEPILKNGEKLQFVTAWIKGQVDAKVASTTIDRRIAALSSIYSFYKELDIVKKNPFKASAKSFPSDNSGAYCDAMDMEQLKQVFEVIEALKSQGVDIKIPVKLLTYTGLRNEGICTLRTKDFNFDENIIVYNSIIRNSKHKLQFLPIPDKFAVELKQYIEENQLGPEDPLCYGIKGQALQNKQLNRITDKICDFLEWKDEKRITPHGFRYTIATLLDEKDVTHETIKYLLGHSNTENVEFYLRKHRKEIHKIRKALNEIENELESHLEQTHYAQKTQIPIDPSFNISGHEEKAEENELPFPEDFLVRLAAESPKMFEKIMTDHLNNKSYPKSS